MAIEFTQAVWEISPHKAEKLLVLLACADWANHDGEFWPSLTEIARKARLTKPGVIGIMEQLRGDGEVVLQEAGNGRGHRNCYQFGAKYLDAVNEIRDRWQAKREEKGKAPLPIRFKERVNDNIKRVNEEDEKGKPELAHIRKNRHEPLIEPSCGAATAAPTQDPLSIHREIFGEIPIYQQELILNADIQQLTAWRKTCQDWKDNRYSTRNVTGLIDSYYRAEVQTKKDKDRQNGTSNYPIRESNGERAARESLELIAALTGAGRSTDHADSENTVAGFLTGAQW